MKSQVGEPRLWQYALAVLLIYFSFMLLEVIYFNGAEALLGLGAFVTAVLILINK
jgi:hypothetical protein